MSDEDIKSLWRHQPEPEQVVTLEQIRQQAEALHRRHIRENWYGQLSCSAVMLVFGVFTFLPSRDMMRLGAALVVLGSAVILYRLRRRASIGTPPEDAIAGPYLEYMKAELSRQRDALRAVLLWYVAPVTPGLVLLVRGMANDSGLAFPWQLALLFMVPFLVVIWMHFAKARRLQRRIDELQTWTQ